jgi:hypothetical protein
MRRDTSYVCRQPEFRVKQILLEVYGSLLGHPSRLSSRLSSRPSLSLSSSSSLLYSSILSSSLSLSFFKKNFKDLSTLQVVMRTVFGREVVRLLLPMYRDCTQRIYLGTKGTLALA